VGVKKRNFASPASNGTTQTIPPHLITIEAAGHRNPSKYFGRA